MTSKLDTLSAVERQAHSLWLANATHVHFGLCARCRRTEDADGRPLLVARQERARRFECWDCWEARR